MRTRFRVQFCALALGLILPLCALSAHAQDGKKKPADFKEEGKKLFDKNKPASGGNAGKDAAGTAEWAVAVFTFRGDERAAESKRVLEYIRGRGLPDARMEERGPSVVILVGSFSDPQSADAQAALDRIRKIKIEDNLPYASAFLAPPSSNAGEGRRPEINLLRVKEQHPGALYSFQVAAYGRDDIKDRPATEEELKESRRSAEQAALQLRSEGEEAYYYHGPRKSMVTIGTFDLTDYDPQMPQFESDRIKQVRKRHPLNLYNGAAIKIKTPGNPDYLQPSQLVAIPSK